MKPLREGTDHLTPAQIAQRQRDERRRAIEAKGATASIAERVERLEILMNAPIDGE